MSENTLFLRLEGPLQAWGNQESKFLIRRTSDAPTKSGVIGMLCAALGIPRALAGEEWLPKLSALRFGVRIDRPGIRWWDYHTVGAKMEMRIAEGEGKSKPGAMLTRREYLCDASFLVVLQGESGLIELLETKLREPVWTLYLGRKSCPPSRPILNAKDSSGDYPDLLSALSSVPWQRRYQGEPAPPSVKFLMDWNPTPSQPNAPPDALILYDVALTFDPPAHEPRFAIQGELNVGPDANVHFKTTPSQKITPAPPRPRADYANDQYRKMRKKRLAADHGLCVLCKSPATTVQHITYRRAGGNEALEDLRSLCRLCHDAVTMLEYGLNMDLDRINPEESHWREAILEKRKEIEQNRSLVKRHRRLSAEEVE